jgi:hypothetical protein
VSRFRFVSDHRDAYGVKRLCRTLEVSHYGLTPGRAVRRATGQSAMPS